MEKIFHKHFASVMQDALAVFRLNNARVKELISPVHNFIQSKRGKLRTPSLIRA